MHHWLILLASSLMFGACIVGAMVLSRHPATLVVLIGIGGFVGSLYTLGTIAQVYATPAAIGSALLVLFAGISLGYTIAASLIPHLARMQRRAVPPRADCPADSAIILLVSAEPDRYDPRTVAHRQNLLSESAGLELSLAATPFMFLTEKSRYRAIGNRALGSPAAITLGKKVTEAWGTVGCPSVWHASDQYPTSLRSAVTALSSAGTKRVAIVSLGQSGSMATERALAELDADRSGSLTPHVVVAPSIWYDDRLVVRLAERILECAGDTALSSIGVALVCLGTPGEREQQSTDATETENYFIQRVRMQLVEAGLAREYLRVAWLDWQGLDVTETVRHLAALGCQRIITVPATTVLPTLGTLLDLERAVTYARVPESVTLVTLGAWGDDDAIAHAVQAAAASTLNDEARTSSDVL